MSHPRLAGCLLDDSRHNFYHSMHKALRLGHCRMLAELGAHDYATASDTATLLQRLRALIELDRAHLDGENREIHPALETRQPGAATQAAEDHAHQEQAFAELESLIRAVDVAIASRRPLAGQALYHRYALFAAADMEHMYAEETEVLSALHAAFSDDELIAIEARMVGAIAPPEMAAYMSLMVPALNQGERAAFLTRMRNALPEMAFAGMLAGSDQASSRVSS